MAVLMEPSRNTFICRNAKLVAPSASSCKAAKGRSTRLAGARGKKARRSRRAFTVARALKIKALQAIGTFWARGKAARMGKARIGIDYGLDA